MRLNIMGKLMLGFGLVLLLMLGTCLYLLFDFKNTDDGYNKLINDTAYPYAWAQGALANYNKAAANLRAYIIDGDPGEVNNCRQAIKDGDIYLDQIASLALDDQEKQQLKNFRNESDMFKQFVAQMLTLVKTREAASGADRAAADKQVRDYLSAHKGEITALTAVAEAFAKDQGKCLDTQNDAYSRATERTVRALSAVVAVIFLLGLLIAFLAARTIANPLRLVDAAAASIAAGDLTGEKIKIKTQDETGRLTVSFNTMRDNLKEIVGQLQEKSQTVAASAAELAAGAESISAGASETASTINQVAATVEQVTTNAQRIADASARAASHAKEGNEGIQSIKEQMDAIQKAAATSGAVIHGLNEAAGKITQIVDLITKIADQTNLLALNAAIEAARAGEHGRGFAVVAEEVRKLAEQSAGAAKEIYALITTVRQESQKAVQVMDQGAVQVKAGAGVVQEVGKTFEKIITAVQGLAGEIQAVAAATEEMSAAVQNVAAATEEQTATMEEVSSTTQGLAGLAGELETLAGRFKLA